MKDRARNLSGGIRGLASLMAFAAVIFIACTVFAQDKIAFGPDDNLDQIREKIKKNNYSFTVKDNWVYRLPPDQKANMFKKRMAPPANQRKIVPNTDTLLRAVANTKAAAASFDWRSYNGHSYIGAVRDQGDLGACFAFGACAAAESTYNFKNGLYDANCVDFSESYIIWTLASVSPYSDHFSAAGGADYDYYELYALKLAGPPEGATGIEGVCSEANFPYTTTQPGQAVINASKNFSRVTFTSWGRVFPADIANTTEQIKTAITTYGCVDVAVYVDNAFSAYNSGVYEDSNTTPDATPYYYTTSNHAVALVGWDDNPPEGGTGCWILRNSWGATWGESGYMRIRYFSAAVNTAAAYLEASGSGGQYSISGTIMLNNGSSAVPTSLNRAEKKGEKGSAQELGMGPVNLIADPGVNKFKVLPSAKASSGTKKTATFSITYLGPGDTDPWGQGWNAVAWPAEAKTAFEFAANAWASELNSSVPITIKAMWTNSLGAGILGSSGALDYVRNFTNAPLADTWYQISLANALSGSDQNPAEADMFIAYSSTFSWYYGTDGNTPTDKYDLTTVSMHEICHSLGFAGSMTLSGGVGSWGGGMSAPINYFAYDSFTENGTGQKLVTAFTNSSAALGAQLTGNNLFINSTSANAANGGTPPDIYAPTIWSQGSSYSHLALKYDGTPNALMTYSVSHGESIHSPGPITQGFLKDEGWSGGSSGPLANVLVSDGFRSATTIADGTYGITAVPDGTYTVTPTLSGYTFTPTTRSVTVNGGNVTDCDFTATVGGDFTATIGTTFTYVHNATFDKKPSVYVTYVVNGKTKRKTVKVTSSSKDFPSSTVNCLWTAKATAGAYVLYVKGKVGGVKFDDTVGAVTVTAPTITAVSSTDISVPGGEITVTGTYFGTKPKAWFAYTRTVSGMDKTCKKNLRIPKGSIVFNGDNGASTLNIVVPKFKGDESNIVLWIDSGTGQGNSPF